ncbi:MAG: hypothetical protein WC250_02465 [Candidatus Paceibacterota bacterium]|jgi:hypothetical protein
MNPNPEEIKFDKSAQAEKLLADLRLYNGVQMKLMKRMLKDHPGGASANFEIWVDCCSPEYREGFFQILRDDPDFLKRYQESEGDALSAVEDRIGMLQELEKQLAIKFAGETSDKAISDWRKKNAKRLMQILHENQELALPFVNHTHDDIEDEQVALQKIEELLK